nr:Retrovirus-related Pol polyprotein from transposon TNT 1-94 [Ipomoea batatas]
MAAWPPINSRSAPIDNAASFTGNPTGNTTTANAAPSSSTPATAPATGPTTTEFGSSVKCIRFDNGCEFNMDEFFSQKGIVHQTSCTYTPQQNSRGECILHAAYIINKLPSAAINNQVPYQVLLKRVPQYQNLKDFGCLAYATIVSPKSKLDARAKKCVFLGCATATKGYKVYDIVSKELFLSRDVIFYENIFSFQQDTRQEGRVPQLILPTVNEVPIEMPDAIQPQNHVRTNTEQTCEQGSLNEQIYE